MLTQNTLMVINTAWHAHTHAGRSHMRSKLHPLSRVERRCSRACLALPSFPTLGLEKCVQRCSYCTHTRLQGGRTRRAGCVLSQESRGGAAGRERPVAGGGQGRGRCAAAHIPGRAAGGVGVVCGATGGQGAAHLPGAVCHAGEARGRMRLGEGGGGRREEDIGEEERGSRGPRRRASAVCQVRWGGGGGDH